MAEAVMLTRPVPGGVVALSGFRVRRILCAELFLEMAGVPGRGAETIASLCQDRWTDLAGALAALTEPVELFSIVGCRGGDVLNAATCDVAFLAAGRGSTNSDATAACRRSREDLRILLATVLDYAELQPIDDEALAAELLGHLEDPLVTEIRRCWRKLEITYEDDSRTLMGFRSVESETDESGGDGYLRHLFAWVPSDDPWRRLLEAIREAPTRAAMVVHLRGWPRAPASCRELALDSLAAAERIESEGIKETATVLQRQVSTLHDEALRRVSLTEGRVLASRLFVTSRQQPSAALLSTVEAAVDDASVQMESPGQEPLFRGGATMLPVDPAAVFAHLDEPTLDLLFSPREASAILRTPMPIEGELPGVRLNRARTAPLLGQPGDDCPVGLNVHRDSQLEVRLDDFMRFRHTYVVGQTGTGKSTLLLHMILHDIRAGRGVAVLDPHGSLINDILLRFPPERADDLVLIDPADVERPVGFNVLRIHESDPFHYQLARDLVIDDLYAYLDRTYDMREVGGPMFETHFRGMLSLLMGYMPQSDPLIPNLMVFRALYTNEKLRRALVSSLRGKDVVLEEFIREIEAISPSSDASLKNMATYVTSKFTRFVSDRALRNITCQNETLNVEEIVNQGKVLLFDLGRGRFGDQAAGLLASQVISLIRRLVMKRGTKADSRPFYLYADEFQLFADERLAELLAEARKFKLSLTIAHQYVQQVPEQILRAVLGNVGTTVVFRVGPLDSGLLEGIYTPIFRSRDLSSLPNFRAYVRSFGRLGQTPFSVEVPPPSQEQSPEIAMRLREQSRQRFGRGRCAVEAEIGQTYRAYLDFSPSKATTVATVAAKERNTADSLLDSMASHLEFLGYEITKDADKKTFRAKHPKLANLQVREMDSGILFSTIFGCNDAAKSDGAEFLRCINALNKKSLVARFYSDQDPNNLALFIETWQPNLYDKAVFGNFIEMLQRDIRLLGDDDSKIATYLA